MEIMLRVLILGVFCTGLYAQKKPVEKPPEQGQLDFVATGAKGEFVPDLTAADIVVSQEGKPDRDELRRVSHLCGADLRPPEAETGARPHVADSILDVGSINARQPIARFRGG